MVPNPTPTTFIALSVAVTTFILIMILPSLLELKKPRDAGPRIIQDSVPAMQTKSVETHITDIEEKQIYDQTLVKMIADIIGILPNLEA